MTASQKRRRRNRVLKLRQERGFKTAKNNMRSTANKRKAVAYVK